MTPDERNQADRLGAYADRWLDGHIDEPTSAEEATFAHLQRVLGTTPSASTTQPITRQEKHMLPIASIQSPPLPTSIRQRSPAMAALSRWQPVFSMAVMFAILAGLVGIAYTGLNRQEDSPEPTTLAALTEGESTPHPIDAIDFQPDCVEQVLGESTEDVVGGRSTIPNYSPASLWVGDPQIEIFQGFLTYLYCQDERPSGSDLTAEERSYLSPRMLTLIDASADTSLTDEFDPVSRIISDFPLPLNNLPNPVVLLADGSGPQHYPFDYWNIYTLPNNRWAAMVGSISTHMLQTGEPIRSGDGELAYVSFIPQGDGFVIDEYFLICPSDIQASLVDEDLTMDREPFDPAELIRNPTATCG